MLTPRIQVEPLETASREVDSVYTNSFPRQHVNRKIRSPNQFYALYLIEA
jgi:hypothetical protein